jgi:hypothetical protein
VKEWRRMYFRAENLHACFSGLKIQKCSGFNNPIVPDRQPLLVYQQKMRSDFNIYPGCFNGGRLSIAINSHYIKSS